MILAEKYPYSGYRKFRNVLHYEGSSQRGFPVTQLVKNLPVMQETLVRSLGQEDLLEKG